MQREAGVTLLNVHVEVDALDRDLLVGIFVDEKHRMFPSAITWLALLSQEVIRQNIAFSVNFIKLFMLRVLFSLAYKLDLIVFLGRSRRYNFFIVINPFLLGACGSHTASTFNFHF